MECPYQLAARSSGVVSTFGGTASGMGLRGRVASREPTSSRMSRLLLLASRLIDDGRVDVDEHAVAIVRRSPGDRPDLIGPRTDGRR